MKRSVSSTVSTNNNNNNNNNKQPALPKYSLTTPVFFDATKRRRSRRSTKNLPPLKSKRCQQTEARPPVQLSRPSAAPSQWPPVGLLSAICERLEKTHLDLDVWKQRRFVEVFQRRCDTYEIVGTCLDDYLRASRGNRRNGYGLRRACAQDLMASKESRIFVVFVHAGHAHAGNLVYRDSLQANGPRYRGRCQLREANGITQSVRRMRLLSVVIDSFLEFAPTATSLDDIPPIILQAALERFPLSVAFPRLQHCDPPSDETVTRFSWMQRSLVITRYAAYAETTRHGHSAGAYHSLLEKIIESSDFCSNRVPPILMTDLSRVAVSKERERRLIEARLDAKSLLRQAAFHLGVDWEYFCESISRMPEGYYSEEVQSALQQQQQQRRQAPVADHADRHYLSLADLDDQELDDLIEDESSRQFQDSEACDSHSRRSLSEESERSVDSFLSTSECSVGEGFSLRPFSSPHTDLFKKTVAEVYMPVAANMVRLQEAHGRSESGRCFTMHGGGGGGGVALGQEAAHAYCVSAAVFATASSFVYSGKTDSACPGSHCRTDSESILFIYRSVASWTLPDDCSCAACRCAAEIISVLAGRAHSSFDRLWISTMSMNSDNALDHGFFNGVKKCDNAGFISVRTALLRALEFFSDIELALAEQHAESPPWSFANYSMVPVQRVDVAVGQGAYRTEIHFGRAPAVTADLSLASTAAVINEFLLAPYERRLECPLATADVLQGVLHIADSRVADALQVGFVPTCPSRYKTASTTSFSPYNTPYFGCEYVYDHAEKARVPPVHTRDAAIFTSSDLSILGRSVDAAFVRDNAEACFPLRRFRISATLSWPLMARVFQSTASTPVEVFFALRWLSKQIFQRHKMYTLVSNVYTIERRGFCGLLASNRAILCIPRVIDAICATVAKGRRENLLSELRKQLAATGDCVNDDAQLREEILCGNVEEVYEKPCHLDRSLLSALWSCIFCASDFCCVDVNVVERTLVMLQNPAIDSAMPVIHNKLLQLCLHLLPGCSTYAASGPFFTRSYDKSHFVVRSGQELPIPLMFFNLLLYREALHMDDALATEIVYGVRAHSFKDPGNVRYLRKTLDAKRLGSMAYAWNVQRGDRDKSAGSACSILKEAATFTGERTPADCSRRPSFAPLPFLQDAAMYLETLSRFPSSIAAADLKPVTEGAPVDSIGFRGTISEERLRALAAFEAGSAWVSAKDIGGRGIPCAWRSLCEWGKVHSPDTPACERLGHREVFPVWQPHMVGHSVQGLAGETMSAARGFLPFAGAHPLFLQCVVGHPVRLPEGVATYRAWTERIGCF